MTHGCLAHPFKVRYKTRRDAERAAEEAQGRARGDIKAYRCGDHFHIGHSLRRGERRSRRIRRRNER